MRRFDGSAGGKRPALRAAGAGAIAIGLLGAASIPRRASAGVVVQSETITVPVTEDESVNSGLPDKSYDGNSFRGGLYSGVDGGLSGAARFYLKFDLPAFDRNLALSHAELHGFYVDDFDPADAGDHDLYFVGSDAWSQQTLTWANQPGHTFGTPEADFLATFATPGTWQAWDVTRVARQEYAGDGVLSLMMQASNESITPENRDWEYFVEREFDPDRSFRLELTLDALTPPPPTGVPLPLAAWSGAVTVGGLALASLRRRRSRATLPRRAS
jgi:hypothetical protein